MIASGGRQFDHPCHRCLHANLGWHIQRPPKQSIFAASTADGSHNLKHYIAISSCPCWISAINSVSCFVGARQVRLRGY